MFTALTILISNIAFAYYAVSSDMVVGNIVLVFFIENLVMSLFTYFRIRKAKNYSVDNIRVGGRQIEKSETSPKKQANQYLFVAIFLYFVISIFLLILLFHPKAQELGMSYQKDEHLYLFIIGFIVLGFVRLIKNLAEDRRNTVYVTGLFTKGLLMIFVLNPVIIFGPMLGQLFQSQNAIIILFFVIKTLFDLLFEAIKPYKKT